MVISLYICLESQDMTGEPCLMARSRHHSDLPTAVGPVTRMSFLEATLVLVVDFLSVLVVLFFFRVPDIVQVFVLAVVTA